MNGEDCVKFLETIDSSKSWQESFIRLSALGFDLHDEKTALFTYMACLDAFKTLIMKVRGDFEAAIRLSPLYEKAAKLKAACRQIAADGDDEMKKSYMEFCKRLYAADGFDMDKVIDTSEGLSEYRAFIDGALSGRIPGKVESKID